MTLGQRLKLHFRITCDLQAQFTRKIIGQGLFFADQNLLTGAIFLLQTDRRAVITLQGGAGGLVEACRSLAHVRRKFRVFQKEWNERQAQACLVAFRQFSDEAGGLLVEGFFLMGSTQQEIHAENAQGACQFIACPWANATVRPQDRYADAASGATAVHRIASLTHRVASLTRRVATL